MTENITPMILLVDDDEYAAGQIQEHLKKDNYSVETVSNKKFNEMTDKIHNYELIIAAPHRDIRDIGDYINEIRKKAFAVPIIAVLDSNGDAVLNAIKGGAFDYIQRPLEMEVLSISVFRALEHHRLLKENQSLYEYIELYAACKRVITQINAEDMRVNALEAFVTEANARAGAYITMLPKFNEPRIFEVLGLEDFEARECINLLHDYLKENKFKSGPLQRLNIEQKFPPTSILRRLGFCRAELLLLKDNTNNHGVLVAFVHKSDSTESPKFIDNSVFLARHILIGWNNVIKHASARRMAYIDPLTGLFNSTYIEKELERFQSNSQKRATVILFLDLDHFKYVNDNHGHLNGSEVLIEVSKVIKRCVRESDSVARFGGDEYIVLLRNTPLSEGVKVAERIRSKIESQHFLGREGFTVRITTCIGVAATPDHTGKHLDLIGLADTAMYVGKHSGRNQVNIAEKKE